MLHGIFEDDGLRAALHTGLRTRCGLGTPTGPRIATREEEYDRLAAAVRENIDWS